MALRPIAAGSFDYRLALPGYEFAFPKDHDSHPDFRTEWWYFTGHLHGQNGRKWGYELTFFRFGLKDRDRPDNASAWHAEDLFFAHFALTDVTGRQFRYFERRARTSVGLAGIRTSPFRLWIGDWVAENTDSSFTLKAAEPGGPAIDLELRPLKPPVIHGLNGVSQKSDGQGQASHYYSLTRLNTTGALTLDGQKLSVTGLSWMDHEFGSNQISPEQIGWDWFSVQLQDQTELMLYQMRRKDGKPDPHRSGTFVRPDGTWQHLRYKDFQIESSGEWVSPKSGGRYANAWTIRVPEANLHLRLRPNLPDQELVTDQSTQVTYWEGSVSMEGESGGKPVKGHGYVEMTGYAGSLEGKF